MIYSPSPNTPQFAARSCIRKEMGRGWDARFLGWPDAAQDRFSKKLCWTRV